MATHIMGTKLVDSKHPQFHMEFSIIFAGNLRETQLLISRMVKQMKKSQVGKAFSFIKHKKRTPIHSNPTLI